MDIPRIALAASIAAVSFMLLTEWVEFRKRTVEPAARVGDPLSLSVEPEVEPSPEVPSVESLLPASASGANASDEIPDRVAVAERPRESTASYVIVESDVLRLRVDLRGGDIVHAELPKFAVSIEEPERALVILERSPKREYVAQSGLIGASGIDTPDGRALFESAQTRYVLPPDAAQLLVDLRHRTADGVEVIKRFTLKRGDYLVDVDYLIDNRSEQPWRGALFAQIKRDQSPDPGAQGAGFGIPSYLGAALALPDKKYHKLSFDDIEEEVFRETVEAGWLAMVQHYFVSAWVPADASRHRYEAMASRAGEVIVRMLSGEREVAASASGQLGARFYVGPKDQYRLRDIANGLDLTVDYGWLWWIAQPLFWLLTRIYGFLGNWGAAIIGLTLVVKLVFFQLSSASYRSMARMRRLQPQMLELRERHEGDRQRLSREMMELYRKEKVNPLGGCLPMLVQMPVFIALYWVLLESVELRHAPFVLWIKDLSVMDPYFVLPTLMGASMFVQQKLTPPPPDPLQARIMKFLPVIFTLFFVFFPAGLVLYWLANNLLSIAQQWFITHRVEQALAKKGG